jgi:hypothetical protein
MEDLPADHERSPDAGAESEERDRVPAPPRPEARFRQGTGIRIVLDLDRERERPPECPGHLKALEAGQIGAGGEDPGRALDEPRNAHAGGAGPGQIEPGTRGQLARGGRYAGHELLGPGCRFGRNPPFSKNLLSGAKNGELGKGPADVDPERERYRSRPGSAPISSHATSRLCGSARRKISPTR